MSETPSDHDILIEIRTTLTLFVKQMSADIDNLKGRVSILERAQDKETGFLAGAQWLWGILGIGAGFLGSRNL